MTTPARSFQLSRPKSQAELDAQYPPLSYTFTDDEPEGGWPVDEDEDSETYGQPLVKQRTLTAHFPGSGVFDVLIAQTGMADIDGQAIAGSLFAALKRAFPENRDYEYLKAKVETEELDAAQLMDLIEDMIEQWAAFPTRPSSASTRSQRRTGGRSTGRVPATASTPAASRPSSPTDSAA